MRELGILQPGEKLNNANKAAKFEELWKKVDLKDVLKFEKDIETTYAKYWLKAAEGYGRVREIHDLTDGLEAIQRFKAGKGSRLKQVLPHLAGALAIFCVIGENTRLFANIAMHSPEQDAAFQTFMSRYNGALQAALDNDSLGKDEMQLLREDFIKYLRSIQVQENVISIIDAGFEQHLAN